MPEQIKGIIKELSQKQFGTTFSNDGYITIGSGSPSLELIDWALSLESTFQISFDLAEISDENFLKVDWLATLIAEKIHAKKS